MRPRLQNFNALRAKSYLTRLPLFTRLMVLAIIALSIASFQSVWNLREWGALIPEEISITNAYRLSTFPLIHLNVLHAILNLLALTPLLERFENEHGTLTSLALFFGPLTSIPAVIYVLIERCVFRANHGILGASMWVFTLLAMESIRTYKANPHFVIGTVHIPTWTTPLIMCLVVAALIPGTSLLGHLCGVAIGYVAGFGYAKLLAPPEWGLRWVENKLNLLKILPHYVSIDKTTYGRFGVLPTANRPGPSGSAATELVGTTQRLGP
ncbi:putative rhomboid protease [Fusarium torreyae]|uniref:rhomboid protease n=1 Tax=Fusarium torreyae TaxID=1237075 RepID=A0A9W8RP19_9HYPO|nr:putative rhomboid protease [Fusarium torreyae]